jgi:hypothetical protein
MTVKPPGNRIASESQTQSGQATACSNRSATDDCRARLAVRVSGVWAGVDRVREQEKLDARELPDNSAESHTSAARRVGRQTLWSQDEAPSRITQRESRPKAATPEIPYSFPRFQEVHSTGGFLENLNCGTNLVQPLDQGWYRVSSVHNPSCVTDR